MPESPAESVDKIDLPSTSARTLFIGAGSFMGPRHTSFPIPYHQQKKPPTHRAEGLLLNLLSLTRYFSCTIRQTVPDPSSVTNIEPSFATVTPTGRPHTCPSSVTKPVMKSSYSPFDLPLPSSGTRITL